MTSYHGYTFACARELFESAAEASRDAERVRRQLDAMSERAASVGGSSLGVHVRSTGEPDCMASRVAALVDMEAALLDRQKSDYALMSFALHVLYGDGESSGLHALVGWRADALAWHYLEGKTWGEVGELMGYTDRYVWEQAQVALDVCDGYGLVDVMRGRGTAED